MEVFKIVEATQDYINTMKGRIREIDEIESHASIGKSGDDALQLSFEYSQVGNCWVIIKGEKAYVAFGVAPMGATGIPWLLASIDYEEAWMTILRHSKEYIQKMIDPFESLQNIVHSKNIKSIKWLKWCGFTIEKPEPYGVAGETFHRFWLSKGGDYV